MGDTSRHQGSRNARATDCLLCDELHGENPLSVRLGRCQRLQEIVLLESEHFLLVPDISPLIPGHCLLVTRHHYSSFAQVPASLAREVQQFTAACIERLSAEYSKPLLFEHGSAPDGPRSGACIHHAHIHFLPVMAPVREWMAEFGDVTDTGGSQNPGNSSDIPTGDYLAYSDQSGQACIVGRLRQTPPCQFIRRRIARHLGLPQWHWRQSLQQLPAENGCLKCRNGTHVAG